MGDWYLVIKTIGGRRYLYRQKSWREGKRVRTQTQCLGRADSTWRTSVNAKGRSGRLGAITAEQAVEHWEAGSLLGGGKAELSPDELDAIKSYMGSGSRWMNSLLRSDSVIDAGQAETMGHIVRALEHSDAVLQHNVHLYRGCLIPEGQAKAGGIFDDFAFMSFSLDVKAANKFSETPDIGYVRGVLRLVGRAGDRGYISGNGISSFGHERELLRLGGRFIVVDVIDAGAYKIYCVEEERFLQ